MLKEVPSSSSLKRLLSTPKYEIIPMKNVENCLAHIPRDANVSITVSPSKGIASTLELAKEVSKRLASPEQITPHLSARLVESSEQLKRILTTVKALGINEIFIVGGDSQEAAGPFKASYDLLIAIRDLDDRIRLGITAYPEGHPSIPKEVLAEDLARKAPYAQFMATQLCFEADTLKRWLEQTRHGAVSLALQIGVAGVIDMIKLMTISSRIGVGDSIRYVSKHASNVLKLMGGYKPDDLLERLTPLYDDPFYHIEAFHIYTFNNVEKTESWRQQKLQTLAKVVA